MERKENPGKPITINKLLVLSTRSTRDSIWLTHGAYRFCVL